MTTAAAVRAAFGTTLALLVVIVALAGCSSTRTVGEQVDDATITTKVKSKITADPQVNPFNIDVDTVDGVVTLSGEVETETARAEAGKLAADTEGVVRVVNDIRVGGGGSGI